MQRKGRMGGIFLLMAILLFSFHPKDVRAEQYLGDDISKQFLELPPFDEEAAEKTAKELQEAMKAYEAGDEEALSGQGSEEGGYDASASDDTIGVLPTTDASSTGTAEAPTENTDTAAGRQTVSDDLSASEAQTPSDAPMAPDMQTLEPEEFFALYGTPESFLEELDADREPGDEESISAEGVSMFYTESAATEYLRKQMVKRKEKIIFDMELGKDNSQLMSLKKVQSLPYEDTLFSKPDEGDYLFWSTAAWRVSYQYVGKNRIRYYVYVKYFSSAAQEKYVDAFITAFIQKFGLANATDQEKIRLVYWYMTKYIVYDYYHLEQNPHYGPMRSAYGAVHDGSAVCQGYANLFYRMMRKMGVSCRIVTSETHAWNIVALAGKYYNGDTTWDAGYTATETDRLYRYFMKTDQDMFIDDVHGSEHVREARCNSESFYSNYPMTQMSYPVSLWYYGSLLGSIDQLNQLTVKVETEGVPENASYTTFALTAQRTKNREAQLAWGACENAVRYDVYGKREGESFMWLASTAGTSVDLKLKDSAATRYYVCAINDAGKGCGISKTVFLPAGEIYANKGLLISDGIGVYKITASSANKKTVTLTKWLGSDTTVDVPDSVLYDGLSYKVDRIGSNIVRSKKSIRTLVIGTNVTTIDKKAFSGCSRLCYVEIRSKKLKKVGKEAFKKTASSLTVICKKGKKKKYLKLITGAKKGGKVLYGKL
ncbi:MAG: leucine-rich repeat protein [Lachnospiraceae bacterium]|nr:leucine-rich repeat protein [Lachnospiraceae bacterium]